ncbi:Dual specificity protein phosphatase 12, partial [Orchesella cincta]
FVSVFQNGDYSSSREPVSGNFFLCFLFPSAPTCNPATNGNETSSGSGEDSVKVSKSKIGATELVEGNQLKSQGRDSILMSDNTGSDITFGRQSSWRKRICERTRRSRSMEEDYGENSVDMTACVDLIEKGLYLGNKDTACDIRWLKHHSITHILTIDSCPLPTKITDLPFVKTKYLQVTDMAHEDILQYFEETNRFIQQSICNEVIPGNILVHCYYGVSRSATIVLAYLMHKYNISLEEALERVKSKREAIGPNHGFISQLKLYEKMGYHIDRSSPVFKRFRLHMAALKMKSVKVLPPPYTDVIRPDPALFSVRPEPVVYRCKKCRRILASGSNLLLHNEGKTPRWPEFLVEQDEATTSLCTQMHFIEPIVWMREAAHNLQGKLHCPNALCKSKLGSFSWVMGCLCPCGAKVQPAFYLVPSKIDRSNSVLNLQITL